MKIISGTLAWILKLDSVEDHAAFHRIHRVPAGVDCLYTATRSQIQQSAHYQIHVISDIAHLLNDPFNVCWNHAFISGCEAKSAALLVRMGTTGMAQWSFAV